MGINEIKDLASDCILKRMGFSSSSYDNILQELVDESGISLNTALSPSMLDSDEDLTGKNQDLFWLGLALKSIVKASIPVELLEIIKPNSIKIKVEQETDPYGRWYRGIKMSVLSKEQILMDLNSKLVLEKAEVLKEFMEDSYEPYKKIKNLINKINEKFNIIE